MTILPSTIPLTGDPEERRQLIEQRCLAAINRARCTSTRRLRRRCHSLMSAYRSGTTGGVVLELAATVMVLRERGIPVRGDGTIRQALNAVSEVSRTYRTPMAPRT